MVATTTRLCCLSGSTTSPSRVWRSCTRQRSRSSTSFPCASCRERGQAYTARRHATGTLSAMVRTARTRQNARCSGMCHGEFVADAALLACLLWCCSVCDGELAASSGEGRKSHDGLHRHRIRCFILSIWNVTRRCSPILAALTARTIEPTVLILIPQPCCLASLPLLPSRRLVLAHFIV